MAATEGGGMRMPTGEKPARGTVTQDPELAAMVRIERALATLDRDAQWRVLTYLRDKRQYDGPPLPADPQGKLLD